MFPGSLGTLLWQDSVRKNRIPSPSSRLPRRRDEILPGVLACLAVRPQTATTVVKSDKPGQEVFPKRYGFQSTVVARPKPASFPSPPWPFFPAMSYRGLPQAVKPMGAARRPLREKSSSGVTGIASQAWILERLSPWGTTFGQSVLWSFHVLGASARPRKRE